jgi:N6-L-threonylcarbamoyladenine synthase
LYEERGDRQEVSAFVFDFIGRTLERMCEDIMEKYGDMPVIFAGGVMSNKLMRKRLGSRFDAYFSEPEFSADNAAGAALLCRIMYKNENCE